MSLDWFLDAIVYTIMAAWVIGLVVLAVVFGIRAIQER
jgi:hypothetical protein